MSTCRPAATTCGVLIIEVRCRQLARSAEKASSSKRRRSGGKESRRRGDALLYSGHGSSAVRAAAGVRGLAKAPTIIGRRLGKIKREGGIGVGQVSPRLRCGRFHEAIEANVLAQPASVLGPGRAPPMPPMTACKYGGLMGVGADDERAEVKPEASLRCRALDDAAAADGGCSAWLAASCPSAKSFMINEEAMSSSAGSSYALRLSRRGVHYRVDVTSWPLGRRRPASIVVGVLWPAPVGIEEVGRDRRSMAVGDKRTAIAVTVTSKTRRTRAAASRRRPTAAEFGAAWALLSVEQVVMPPVAHLAQRSMTSQPEAGGDVMMRSRRLPGCMAAPGLQARFVKSCSASTTSHPPARHGRRLAGPVAEASWRQLEPNLFEADSGAGADFWRHLLEAGSSWLVTAIASSSMRVVP